jgi:hypothetical protein
MIAAHLDHSRPENRLNDRLQVAAGWAISVVLLTALVVAASALGTSILGVPTYYGSGMDSTLGAQVARDFLADQQAEATALSTGDQSPLGGHFTDSALGDVVQQISNQSALGAPPQLSFQPASLTILRASDPSDASFTIEVKEDGTKTVVSTSGPNSAPTEQTISFHGDYWMRIPSGSHYAIADMNVQALPSSPLPAIAVVAAALVVVGLAGLLYVRQRAPRQAHRLALVSEIQGSVRPPNTPPVEEAVADAPEPAPATLVSTFGGLHVREGGTDWAQELMARPVTGFVWLRVLVAAIIDPHARPSREEVAQQASPGLKRDVQLKRLRNVIGRGLRDMPAPLSSRVIVEPEALSFRLDGCAVDAIELLAVSAECSSQSLLSALQVARVRRVLQVCKGDFLPEFDTIENIATDRHPTCTTLVAELRELLISKRADLSLLLADAHLRDGRPGEAIAILEPALSDRGERKDLADRLAAAYRAAGRDAEAKALAARYA